MRTAQKENLDTIVRNLLGTDGEERFDGLLWYRENEKSIACCNADTVRRIVRIDCAGTAVRLICGRMEQVVFASGSLTVLLDAGESVVLEVLDTRPLGLYRDAVLLGTMQNGTYVIRGTGGKTVWAVHYIQKANVDEISDLQQTTEGTTFSIRDGEHRINLLIWDGIKPLAQTDLELLTKNQI